MEGTNGKNLVFIVLLVLVLGVTLTCAVVYQKYNLPIYSDTE